MAHFYHTLLTAIGLKKDYSQVVVPPESERRKQVEYLRQFRVLLLVDECDYLSLVASIESPERAQQEFAQARDRYNGMWGAWVQ